MSLPEHADRHTIPTRSDHRADEFALRVARAVDVLRAGPHRSQTVHTAADRTALAAAPGPSLLPLLAVAVTLVAGMATTFGLVVWFAADGDPSAPATPGWAAVMLAGWIGSAVAAGAAGGAVIRVTDAVQSPDPAGITLHGHAATAYTTVLDAPARLRELGASEHAVGAVEELVPVAEHLAETLGALRTELVVAGDPAGDTTGTPAHEQMLALAGEVAAVLDAARESRQALAAHTHAALPAGTLAGVHAAITAETTAAREALDRAG